MWMMIALVKYLFEGKSSLYQLRKHARALLLAKRGHAGLCAGVQEWMRSDDGKQGRTMAGETNNK